MRQRPGLVEGHDIDLRRSLDHGATLHQEPAPRPGGHGRSDGGGDRDDQRARAADQQKRKAAINPGVPRLTEGQRRHQHHQRRDGDDGGHIPAAEPVDETFGRRAGLFGLFDKADDAGDGVVFGAFGHLDPQGGLGVDRACKDRIPRPARLGHAFAGDRAFIDARGAIGDLAIGRNAVAGAHKHGLADGQAGRWHLARRVAGDQLRRLRHQIGQRPDAVACLACGHAFQHFAHGKQEDDQCRLFGRIDEQRTDGGDGHQAFDGERLAHPQRGKGTLRHRGNPDQTGGNEGPLADLGRQILDDPGRTQQEGGEDDELALAGLIPALAAIGGVVMDMAGAAVTAVVARRCLCGLWGSVTACMIVLSVIFPL